MDLTEMNGKFSTIIDECDSDLTSYRWGVMQKGGRTYFRRSFCGNKAKFYRLLHREIMERMINRALLPKEFVDHIDNDPFNNTRSNLRIATRSQNLANSKRPARNTSGFKGVTWASKCNKWNAQIKHNQQRYHLGYFDLPEEAHEAYKKKAVELFGEFARFE